MDVITFDSAVARGERSSLETAVTLYEGPLLEGWSEEWVLQERYVREQSYLEALEMLARRARAEGALGEAERHLRRIVAVEPFRESAHRPLMELLAAGGNYSAALELYRNLCHLLGRELDTKPDPRTVSLYERIRERVEQHVSGAPHPPALERRPPHLPDVPTRFIGRAKEVAEAKELLSANRLVTLIGAGGCGKTRVALQIAAEILDAFEDGVFFVALASIRDPGLVAATLAEALGLLETNGRSVLETLKGYLREKHLLLVLDNFEQIREAASLVAELLSAAPRLRILLTSRAVLRVRGEQEYVVPPLAVPDLEYLPPLSALARYPAVELFTQRAQNVRHDFALTTANARAVAEICHRLDGLPLAIELAAAWMKLFTPQGLLERLVACGGRETFALHPHTHAAPGYPGNLGRPQGGGGPSADPRPAHSPLQVLTGGPRDLPERQQTLRNTLSWSYTLLDELEQTVFRRLSVFAGGRTLAAAEAVCSDCGLRIANCELKERDPSPIRNSQSGTARSVVIRNDEVLEGIASLLGQSLLVRQNSTGAPRFTMLETIRDYGLECLEQRGEATTTRQRHARFFLALSEEAEMKLRSSKRGDWLTVLQADHDNIRTVLAWTLSAPETAEMGLRLAGNLLEFWYFRGHLGEGQDWLEGALALAPPVGPTRSRARGIYAAGRLAWRRGDPGTARERLEESVTMWRELGDRSGLAYALTFLGLAATSLGDRAAGRAAQEEAIEILREIEDEWGHATTLYLIGKNRDGIEARDSYEEALGRFRALGDALGIAVSLIDLGHLATREGDSALARERFEEGLAILREVRDGWRIDGAWIARFINELAFLSYRDGDLDRAQILLEESLAMLEKSEDPITRRRTLRLLAEVAEAHG